MKYNISAGELQWLDKLSNASPEACAVTATILCKKETPQTMLDIGARGGRHEKLFQKCGINVETIDLDASFNPTYVGDFLTYEFPKQFDALWCNHTLEHQINVNLFLKKMLKVAKPGGLVTISVPKAYYRDPPHKIVSGHVTMWNAGLLLYNMILAGFDCSKALVRTRKYNVSVVVGAKKIEKMPALTMNRGDIERLAPYFPFEAKQGFDGDIENIGFPL